MKRSELREIIYEILKEEDSSEKIITKKTFEDPETGRMEWDVEYKDDLNRVYSKYDNFLDEFEDLIKSNTSSDTKLEDILDELKEIKSRLHTYILRKRKK